MGKSKLDSLFVEYDVMYEYKDLEVNKIFVEYSPINSPQLDLLLSDSLDVVCLQAKKILELVRIFKESLFNNFHTKTRQVEYHVIQGKIHQICIDNGRLDCRFLSNIT